MCKQHDSLALARLSLLLHKWPAFTPRWRGQRPLQGSGFRRLPGYKPGAVCHWKALTPPNHLGRQIFIYFTSRETVKAIPKVHVRLGAMLHWQQERGHLASRDTTTFSFYPWLSLFLSFPTRQMTHAAFTRQIWSINSKTDPPANEGMGCLLLTKEAAYLWTTAFYGRRGSFLPTLKYRFHFHMCINDHILLCISCCWTYFKDDRKPLCISSC